MSKLEDLLRRHKRWLKCGTLVKPGQIFSAEEILGYYEAKKQTPVARELRIAGEIVTSKENKAVWFEPF